MSAYRDRLKAALMFEPRPSVVQWLGNILIPKSISPARIKGASAPFSLHGQAFARHILETVKPDSGITDVTVCGATQVFKTFGMLMMIAYRIANASLPQLIVFPTKDIAQKAFSRKKLQPLINANPMLASMKPGNSDQFTDMEMAMLGGAIRLTGTNSPANLSSTSEGLIWQDECCKFEHHESEDSPESHPMKLADERASDFGADAFRYKSSSPNTVMHPFWNVYESGTQTHFLVTCPNCSHHFPFEDWPDGVHDFTHIGYEKAGPDYKALRWSPDARDAKGFWDEQKVRETIRYHCPSCDYPITENERHIMLEHVEHFDLNTTASARHRSFRLPKFYTLSQTMGSIAWNRIKPGDLFGNIQHHANSWLANPWQDIQAQVKGDDVQKLITASNYYRGTIARTPMALVMGADIGDYRQHWAVCAIYEDDAIDVIDWGTCVGIDELITIAKTRRYAVAGTGEWLSPTHGLVDSKHNPLDVFRMCVRSLGFWFPARGTDSDFGVWGVSPGNYQRPDLYSFSSFHFKRALYIYGIKEMRQPRLGLPRDADGDLVQGLSGQQLVSVNGKEQFKRVAHDHYGDAILRCILGRYIIRARRGETAPDIPVERVEHG